MKPGVKEHLVGDPVANARSERLVEEEAFEDGARPRSNGVAEAVAIRELRQRVKAQLVEWRRGGRIGDETHARKAAGVGQGSLGAVVHLQQELGEFWRPVILETSACVHIANAVLAADEESAGHTEVKRGIRRPIQLEPHVLTFSPCRIEALALQGVRNAASRFLKDNLIAHLRNDPSYHLADKVLLQQTPNVLHFRQLWHSCDDR
mmetsp:Transcript_10763/g.32944  ORF Transcript_10763/g.32944 Transcript_10763/m.32944 type:complete len:206 (-) Transcript_10763:51-668(-)